MTKVKICGITNLEDALLSVKFGADVLGFNFYPKSPRYIEVVNAGEIVEQLPADILKVGVFVNESLEKIAEIAEYVRLDALQLHGEETPEFAKELKKQTNLEIIKAFRVSPEFKPEDVLQYEVDAILLDAYSPKEHGGTGETFDWEIAKQVQEIFPKMYLAGGLNPENIVTAIRNVKSFAIDACSGIESEKGRKDKVSTINFIKLSKNADWVDDTQNSADFELQNIEQVLRFIHTFPALYLGKKSLSRLSGFLSGLSFSCDIHPESCNHSFRFSDKISFLLQSKYGSLPIQSILEECNNDEEKAFDLFFARLEEFKLEKEDSIK